MSEAAWNKAFTQGSKAMQDRLRKVHAKNPKFQAWLQKSGHGSGQSVKQASKEVKATERAKKLAQQSLKAYGATKGRRMGGEDGSGETLRDTIAPLTRDQHSKVQAAQRAAKAAAKPAKPAAPKKPLTKDQRIAAIAAAARKAKAKHDVPTMDVDDDHDDLRDLHQSLHIRRGYNEEMDKEVELEEADMSNKEKKKEYVRQVGLKAIKQGKVDPARGHSPQRFGREILKGAAADRAVRKAMEKELTRMGEEVELEEGKMKDIVTDREKTARLAALEKEPPFTPDKKPVRRGRGGPMSQAKWLAKQAMMKAMKKEEVVNEVAEEPKHGDAGEYDYEGDMAKSQLRSIMTNAKRMHDMLEDNTNLPEWVQSKITLAEDYVLTATNYMESEMNEEVEQIDELKKSTLKSYVKKASKEMDKAYDYHQMRYGGRDGSNPEYMKKTYPAALAKYDRRDAGVEKAKEKLAKEETETVEEKYMGFKAVEKAVAEKGARDPAAVAAAIGRKKYGKEKFQAAAAAGKKMSEALDPVGKEDKDIDNDGDSDKTDVYLATKRKAIGKAIKDRLAKKLGK